MDDDVLIKDINPTEEEGIMKTLEDEDESLKFKKTLIIGIVAGVLLIIIIKFATSISY